MRKITMEVFGENFQAWITFFTYYETASSGVTCPDSTVMERFRSYPKRRTSIVEGQRCRTTTITDILGGAIVEETTT